MTTILILVAYDIINDRRRTKLHKLLSRFGDAAQYSFFECKITSKQFDQLREAISKLIDHSEDNVRYYQICEQCGSKRYCLGNSPQPSVKSVYII
jgi:CRISPR-associated protein Cas2